MKKVEIFGMSVCLLGIFLLGLGIGGLGWCAVVSVFAFAVGSLVVDGEAKYLLPPDVKLPEEIAMGLVGHNIKEFSNLAKILPSVYAEEKDHW